MTLRALLIVTTVFSCAGVEVVGAQGFPHPLYMHGLQDLRKAEHSWYAGPVAVRSSKHGRLVLEHINAAQYIIYHVAPEEHMNLKAAQTADTHSSGGESPVADTQKYLQQALVDVSQKETDTKLERTRQQAIAEVKGALYEAKAASAQTPPIAGSPTMPAAAPRPAPRS